MKKLLFSTLFILAICNLAFAQNKLPELEKVKQIKALESTFKDVKKILEDFENDDDEDEREQWFSNDNVENRVKFLGGGCSEDEGLWNVPEKIVTSIEVSPENDVGLKDVNFNISKFKKEKVEKDFPNDYDLHDENAGVLIRIEENKIQKIVFYPPKSKHGFLCDNENGLNILSGEVRFVDSLLINEIFVPFQP